MEAATAALQQKQIAILPLPVITCPDPPVEVCVEQITFNRVLLTWNPPANQGFNFLSDMQLAVILSNTIGTTYTVQMAESVEPYQTVYSGPLTQYTCSSHKKGTSYIFRIQSHNSIGFSSVWSKEVCIITADDRITSYELHKSIAYNHMVWAEYIILTQPHLVNTIRHGQTALSLACSLGRSTLIELLYLCGANINLQQVVNGKTSLMEACIHGHTKCAEMLLRLGARWDMESIWGLTALHLAVLYGQLDTVRLLLSFGVPVDIVGRNDPLQRTPLHCCGIHSLNHSVVRLLIDYNANVNRADANGNTPLLLAIQHKDRTEKNILVVKELLSGNADPNQKNYKTGMYPLVHALYAKKSKVVKLLKKYMDDEAAQWNENEYGVSSECEDYA